MSAEASPGIRTIKVLEADLCNHCNFAYIADVVYDSGRRGKMIYCARGDCDNRITEQHASPQGRL